MSAGKPRKTQTACLPWHGGTNAVTVTSRASSHTNYHNAEFLSSKKKSKSTVKMSHAWGQGKLDCIPSNGMVLPFFWERRGRKWDPTYNLNVQQRNPTNIWNRLQLSWITHTSPRHPRAQSNATSIGSRRLPPTPRRCSTTVERPLPPPHPTAQRGSRAHPGDQRLKIIYLKRHVFLQSFTTQGRVNEV